jgi:hypothetical protein
VQETGELNRRSKQPEAIIIALTSTSAFFSHGPGWASAEISFEAPPQRKQAKHL